MGSLVFESYITWVRSWTVKIIIETRSSNIEEFIDFFNKTIESRPHVTSNEKILNIAQFLDI